MIVKNTTDFFHASLHTSRRPPQPDMVLVVRGTFQLVKDGVVEVLDDFDTGFMSGPQYAEDDDDLSGALLHPNDFADMKLSGEVMLMGTAYAPQKNTTTFPVRLSVGGWKKELMIYGDRRWERGITGSSITDPTVTEQVPLDYAHAFGGEGFAPNPVGRGHAGDALPNVEIVGEPIQRRDQTPPPGGFSPLNAAWPQRKQYQGKQYGGAYQKERAPYYAADHDWRWFSEAPPDQQIEGYWRGDETVVLQNLHPDHPVFKTQLPAVRLRAFVKDETDKIRSVDMVLDTILCEPDRGLLKLTWRGLTEVAEDDLSDVTHVYLASEALDSEPLPDAHYHAALEAYAEDPTGVLAAIPKEMMEEYERQEQIRRGEAVAPRAIDPALDPVQARIQDKMGPLVDASTLEAIGGASRAMTSVESPEGADVPDLAKAIANIPDAPLEAPMMRMLKPGRLPDPGLRRRMREITEQVEKLREAEAKVANEVRALTVDLPQEHGDQAAAQRRAIDEMAAIPHNPKWKELDPEYEPPGPLPTDELGPGADLRERDLSGQDLRGIDLSGANLERANLCRANLVGANLAGANLRRAELYLADLHQANLKGANLELANCICVRAAEADFSGASLSEACFEEAFLEGANFSEVTAEYCVFDKADLRRAVGSGGTFDHSDFSHAKLGKAQFRKVSAAWCLFAEVEAEEIDLSDAVLTQASFVDAQASRAIFVGARANKGFFMKAKLDGADFGYADLTEAHLTEARAKGARFLGTNLREARLYRTNLDGAQLIEANLMGVDARKARVDKTSFAKSNLYEARFIDIRGKDFDLTGCNLAGARVEPQS